MQRDAGLRLGAVAEKDFALVAAWDGVRVRASFMPEIANADSACVAEIRAALVKVARQWPKKSRPQCTHLHHGRHCLG